MSTKLKAFGKILKFEIFGRKKFLFLCVFVGIALLAVLCASVYLKVSNVSSDKKSLYFINEYTSREELKSNLDASHATLVELEKEYEQSKASGAAGFILAEKKTNIDVLKRSIKGMETLYEKNIAYKNVIAYSVFDKANGGSAVVNFINIFAIIVSILMAIRLSVSVPNEIKEGQARFTMITSVGRTDYVLFRWAAELIKNLFAFMVFSLLCFAVTAMFYPTGGKYVLVATVTNSFLLNYGASCFLQILFCTYTLFLISAIAFSVSLVVRSPFLSAGITIVVCFCGRFLELLQSTIGRTVNFAKWLLPLNLRLEQSFTSLTVNSVFVTAIFGISITAFLFFVAMARFNKRDIA